MLVAHKGNKEKILSALDALAIALSEYKHKWTKEQRRLYEKAVPMLKDR